MNPAGTELLSSSLSGFRVGFRVLGLGFQGLGFRV